MITSASITRVTLLSLALSVACLRMLLASLTLNRVVASTAFASSLSVFGRRRKQLLLVAAAKRPLSTTSLNMDISSSSNSVKMPQVIIIAGPTAVGKSDVAACFSNGIIVSADSVQAYTGVLIGANKPTAEERATTPHLLLDMADANVTYNAAEWTSDALYTIQQLLQLDNDGLEWKTGNPLVDQQAQQRHEKIDKEIIEAKRIRSFPLDQPVTPIVVGGTMMYLQWLVHGRPDALKPTQNAINKALDTITMFQAKDDWEGAIGFVANKGEKFQQQAQKLCENDWYRLRRMMEVAFTIDEMKQQSGGPDSDMIYDKLYSGDREGGLLSLGYDVRCFFLCPKDRMAHTKVVDERCEQMLELGLLKETTDLYVTKRLPGMAEKAIGYRQTLDYLRRELPRNDDMESFLQYVKDFCTATRNYSKRQMAWFRKDKNFVFVPVDMLEEKSKRVQSAAVEIQRMVNLSSETFEKDELESPESLSANTRTQNEEQGKGMKVYQMRLKRLVEGSDALHRALKQADACTNQLQGKKARLLEAPEK